MKQRLTPPRSAAVSVLLPHSIYWAFVFLIITFIAPVTHSKMNPGSDLDLNIEHHRTVVKELKEKILQIMGRTTPPIGYNSSVHKSHGKLIREFFRIKLNASSHSDSLQHEDIYLNEPETHVFRSTGAEFMVPVHSHNTPSTPSALTKVKFSTDLQQPEVPYHDLLIKSAILRLRISRQKRKLRRKVKLPLNVTFYLMDAADQLRTNEHPSTASPVHSFTVNNLKSRNIEIDIQPQLLSYLVDSDNKLVTVGILVEESYSVDKTSGNSKTKLKSSVVNNREIPSQENNAFMRISNASLVTKSQTRDLRKARTKRQDEDSAMCTKNLCCRHSIYVDFEKIGWSDWVLFPLGYTAYYCKGGCPDRYKIASSFTNIKSILHERNPDTVPAPVCAPTGYSPLVMMIYDGEIKNIEYPGMVVTGCRCH